MYAFSVDSIKLEESRVEPIFIIVATVFFVEFIAHNLVPEFEPVAGLDVAGHEGSA